jgi:hypothetical protein
MPDPPEPHHIKYEARKLSCDSRKKLNLDIDRFEPWTPELEAECSRLFNERCALAKEKVVWPPISSSNSEDTRCAQDSTESTEDLAESDAESEDEESHEREQDTCWVASIPSTTTPVPVKRTRSNPQDSQARITAIHSFMRNLFGHRLNDCNLISDNAKMAPDRAIDFDALVKRRVRSHRRGRHHSRTTPKDPPIPHTANTKGLGMRTRALPDQNKRS